MNEGERNMIVNETKNDVALNVKVAKRMTGKTRYILICGGIFILACGILTLMLDLFAGDGKPDYFLDVAILLLGVFLIGFGCCFGLILKRASVKTMQGKEADLKYVFSEDGYEMTSTLNDGTVSTTQGSYGAFTEGKEYRDVWLLYINKATVFAIDKAGMKEGTVEELSNLLRQKLGDKYKYCYKRK